MTFLYFMLALFLIAFLLYSEPEAVHYEIFM